MNRVKLAQCVVVVVVVGCAFDSIDFVKLGCIVVVVVGLMDMCFYSE